MYMLQIRATMEKRDCNAFFVLCFVYLTTTHYTMFAIYVHV